jgi:hypothetical protein
MKRLIQPLYFILELSWLYLMMVSLQLMYSTASVRLWAELLTCLFIAMGGMLSWKPRYLRLWDLSGLLLSAILLFYMGQAIPSEALRVLAALSMGFGLPPILSMAMAPSTFNDRGRRGASFGLSVSLVLTLSSALYIALGEPRVYPLILLILKLLALASPIGIFLPSVEPPHDYVALKSRGLAALFISWLAFLTVEGVASYSMEVAYGVSFTALSRAIGMGLAIAFFPLFGYLMDRYGRRSLVLSSYLIIGLTYALISTWEEALKLYPVFEAFSWCALTLFFIFVVWSDVAPLVARTKLYALGSIPVFLSRLILILLEYLGISLRRYEFYPFASLFMFLIAVLLFFLVPETLPSRVVERRRLVEYVEKAKKIREGYR